MQEQKQLSITCSPGTFLRVQNDSDYRDQLTVEVLESQNKAYSEVIFSPVEEGDGKQVWLDAPIKLLLSIIGELQPKVGKSVSIKNKKKMWTVVTERMCLEGYNYSTSQIENKFRSLERQFKKTNLRNKLTGRNRQSCPYQNELETLLGDKRGINPDFLLNSESAEGTGRSVVANDASSDTEYQDDDQPSTSKKIKRTSGGSGQAAAIKAINDIAEERKAYHKQVLDFMQKREEKAQRKEEASKRKLELLEKLANQQRTAKITFLLI